MFVTFDRIFWIIFNFLFIYCIDSISAIASSHHMMENYRKQSTRQRKPSQKVVENAMRALESAQLNSLPSPTPTSKEPSSNDDVYAAHSKGSTSLHKHNTDKASTQTNKESMISKISKQNRYRIDKDINDRKNNAHQSLMLSLRTQMVHQTISLKVLIACCNCSSMNVRLIMNQVLVFS